MTRLNKYMVFNPKEDKPKKYFANRDKALKVARYMRNKYKADFLVLKVDYIAQYELTAEEKVEEINEQIEKQCNSCPFIERECSHCVLMRMKKLIEDK